MIINVRSGSVTGDRSYDYASQNFLVTVLVGVIQLRL